MNKIVVIAKCVGCGQKKEYKAGDVPDGEHPMCDKCFMPMIAEKSIIKAMEGETKLDPEIEQEQAEGRKLQEMYFKVDGEISKLLLEFANTRIKERGNGRNWLLKLRKRITPSEEKIVFNSAEKLIDYLEAPSIKKVDWSGEGKIRKCLASSFTETEMGCFALPKEFIGKKIKIEITILEKE